MVKSILLKSTANLADKVDNISRFVMSCLGSYIQFPEIKQRVYLCNLLSAQVLHTCFARSFRFPMDTALYSAIHLEDSLMEGKSFFLQEVQIVREMLEAGKECWRFFLLDELFKGTNTVERIAIAKAVLSALAHKNSIVFASTHDVELASLLEDEYELFHFCECVADNTLSFDYKLKPGPVTERNAIRIIEMCGYPQEVVREAYRLSEEDVL